MTTPKLTGIPALDAAIDENNVIRGNFGDGTDTHELVDGKLVPIGSAPAYTAKRWSPEQVTHIQPRQWIVPGALLRLFVSVLGSPGGIGKTMFALTVAVSLATGRDLLGIGTPEKPRRIWYWILEDPLEEVQRRIHAICIHYELDVQEVARNLFINSGRDEPLKLATMGQNGLEINQLAEDRLISEIRSNEIDVLYIDPFVSAHGVNENSNNDIDEVVKLCGRIAGRGNCAVQLIHHLRKAAPNEVLDASAFRGGSALIDGVRVAHLAARMTETQAGNFGVSEEDRGYFFSINRNAKANLAPPAEGLEWYRMQSVCLGNGTMDDPDDWVGVPIRWHPPKPTDFVEDIAQLKTIQCRAEQGMWRASDQRREAGDWIGCLVAEVLDIDADSSSDRRIIKRLLEQWIKNGALQKVERKPQGERISRPYVTAGEMVDE